MESNGYMEVYKSKDTVNPFCGQLRSKDGHVFNVNKLQLVQNSEYFYELFRKNKNLENEYFDVNLKSHILENILLYVSHRTISITEETVYDIFMGAAYLSLDCLVYHIRENYIGHNLTISTCLPIFLAALEIGMDLFVHETYRFIQTHFETVVSFHDLDFGKVPYDVFMHFLKDRNLCVSSEIEVWKAIVYWVKADKNNRQIFVPDFLVNLAISDIDESLATEIIKHPIVLENSFCENIKENLDSYPSDFFLLATYIQSMSVSNFHARIPQRLHFIATMSLSLVPIEYGTTIYVTYDENLDLWRSIVKLEIIPDHIFSIGFNIYTFADFGYPSKICRYNLINNECTQVTPFSLLRNEYVVVPLSSFIYVIGGISEAKGEFGELLKEMEIYNCESDTWFSAPPMLLPADNLKGVKIDKSIYMVGNVRSDKNCSVLIQVYDTVSKLWAVVPSPAVHRCLFAISAYRERLYLIGGFFEGIEETEAIHNSYLKTVEVFDPTKGEWSLHKEIPFPFSLIRAFSFNDELLVTGYFNGLFRSVRWDEKNQLWQCFDYFSPMNAIRKYVIFSPDNSECLSWIAKENKNPNVEFEDSPFK